MKKWSIGGKPEEIVEQDSGRFVGFADEGWGERLVKLHNDAIETAGQNLQYTEDSRILKENT